MNFTKKFENITLGYYRGKMHVITIFIVVGILLKFTLGESIINLQKVPKIVGRDKCSKLIGYLNFNIDQSCVFGTDLIPQEGIGLCEDWDYITLNACINIMNSRGTIGSLNITSLTKGLLTCNVYNDEDCTYLSKKVIATGNSGGACVETNDQPGSIYCTILNGNNT